MNLLRKAFEAAADEKGWAGLGAVGHHISKQTSFDTRSYGYVKVSDLFIAIGLFGIWKQQQHIFVRERNSGVKNRPSASG